MFQRMIPTFLAAIAATIQALTPSSDELPQELTTLAEELCKTRKKPAGRGQAESSLAELAASKAVPYLVEGYLSTTRGQQVCNEIRMMIERETGYGSLMACTGTPRKKCSHKTRVFCCSLDNRTKFKCPMCNPKCKVNRLRRLEPGGYNICPCCRGFTLYTGRSIVNGEQASEKTKCFVCAEEKHSGLLRQMAAKLPMKSYIEFLYSNEDYHHLLEPVKEGATLFDAMISDGDAGFKPPTFDAVAQREYLVECLTHAFYEHVFSKENVGATIFPSL